MGQGFPTALPGMRVGLLGGSFDPPHAGHVHITRWALRRFRLDRVWWLVSPGNPLKSEGPAPVARRVAAAEALMRHPRVAITDIEAHLRTRYTAETLRALFARYPGVRFVWLMGADNLAGFHRWQDWPWIVEHVPIGVLARPGGQLAGGLSPMAQRYARFRIRGRAALLLAGAAPPCWTLLTGPMRAISSSDLRAQGQWRR